METGVDTHRLRLGQIDDNEWDRISRAFGRLSEAPIFVDDSATASIMDIRSKARRLQAEQGLDMVIVDYLQLMSGRRSENRVQEISEISRGLKGLARSILGFVGIGPVRTTLFGMVATASPARREAWLARMRDLGGQAR